MKTFLGLTLLALVLPVSAYDIVLNNGRVMDPETGLDAIRHVAIEDARVVAVSERPLSQRGE